MISYFKKSNYRIIFLSMFLILLSLSVFGYFLEYENQIENINDCCQKGKAVFLFSSDGARGFGHVALLLKENENWYYFSWQTIRVVFTEVPNYALKNLDSFNEWINEENKIQNYMYEFDDTIYFCGNFSESIKKAKIYFEDYFSLQEQTENISLLNKNEKYNRFNNNCLHISHNVLKKGTTCNDISIENFVKSLNIIPNIAKIQIKNKFNYIIFFEN